MGGLPFPGLLGEVSVSAVRRFRVLGGVRARLGFGALGFWGIGFWGFRASWFRVGPRVV